MSEAKVFLDARRQLMIDHGVGKVGFIEFATRGGSLVGLIDEARTPVADKALGIWLGSACIVLQKWLMDQPAETILKGFRPFWATGLAGLFIEGFGRFDRNPQGCGAIKVSIEGFGDGYSLEHYHNSVVVVARFKLREECADAAQWLVMNGVNVGNGNLHPVTWLKMGGIHTPEWIIRTGWKYLGEFNAKRQPVADAALILWTVFGARVGPLCETCPVDLLSKFDKERAVYADAAQAFWMIAPEPNAGVTMNRSLGDLLRDARYWRDFMMVECMKDAIAISNGLSRAKASERVRKIAELLLEEVAANESR